MKHHRTNIDKGHFRVLADVDKPCVDHLLGSFSSDDGQYQESSEDESAFGQAVISKLANQGVKLP